MKTNILILCLACGLLRSAAAGEHNARLQIQQVIWRGGSGAGYNVFDPTEYPQQIPFRVMLMGDLREFVVTIESVNGSEIQPQAVQGAETLAYQIYESPSRRTPLKPLPSASPAETIRATFRTNEVERQMQFTIVVPPRQGKPPGFYTDTLLVKVYSGSTGHLVEEDSKTVTLSISVDATTELSFADPGSEFESRTKSCAFDFGPLQKGKTRSLDLRVRSNSGFRVSMESENGGTMKHTDGRIKTTIPYTLDVNGGGVSFKGGSAVPVLQRSRTINGETQHPIRVVIGDTSGAVAGQYHDTIIVTVSAEN